MGKVHQDRLEDSFRSPEFGSFLTNLASLTLIEVDGETAVVGHEILNCGVCEEGCMFLAARDIEWGSGCSTNRAFYYHMCAVA